MHTLGLPVGGNERKVMWPPSFRTSTTAERPKKSAPHRTPVRMAAVPAELLWWTPSV
jgi:hypothetical protein